MTLGLSPRESTRVYWAVEGPARVTAQLRMTVPAVLVLQLGFSVLDRWAFPEHFELFVSLRMAVNALLIGILFWGRIAAPTLSKYVLCLGVAGEILAMVYATGGPATDYYVGLIILLVGMPVLLPLRAREAGAIAAVTVVGFLAAPFLMADAPAAEAWVIPVVFVISGAFESVISCAFLDRARVQEFHQRQQAEQARDELAELDRVKSRFTANVHHELRTPLTLTLAPLEAMLSGEFGEIPTPLLGYLRTMHVNALRLLKLINNLLDLAKVEGQQLQLIRRPVELARLVDDILSGARPLAERKGITLSGRYETIPPVNLDPDAMEKVVVNLVGNALKFTESGGRIEIRVAPRDDGVWLSVEDTGIGLAGDQLDRIFDRFAQVDASATRRHEGTGIGLSLVQELIGLHEGRVWAESAGLGQGTTLHVWLPQGRPDADEPEQMLEDDQGRAVSLEQSFRALGAELEGDLEDAPEYRLAELERSVERWEGDRSLPSPADGPPAFAHEIVVAEDNRDMRRLLGALLGREFAVRLTRNGREALQAVEEHAPDLVLTDVMMPEMSGTELCRAIKQDPETQSIPVMLLTSKADREMRIEGLELGADDYVTKPFHPRELLARVRSLIRVRSLQAELSARNERLETALADLKATEVQLVQSERLAAVGELAAGIAHEANNPVNFALNAARTLRAFVSDVCRVATQAARLPGLDPSEQSAEAAKLSRLQQELGFDEVVGSLEELLGIVTEGLERTERLVGDLRDFAKPGGGVRAPADLAAGLRSTLSLLKPRFAEFRVEVATRIAEDLPHVEADGAELNQVFLNLLKNAADALEETGGRLSIEARRDGPTVVVEIRDDGPGLPDFVRARLFEPFVSTKPAGRGTGLGLSISRRIVEAHHGRLELLCEGGRGTLARVTLPITGPKGGIADAS